MTTDRQIPPPEGPEYAPCRTCSHIEPEHRPTAGPCLLCGCASYQPAARPSCPDPIECGHEAALGLAEMRLEMVHATATAWARPGMSAPSRVAGRHLLLLLDGEPHAAAGPAPATDQAALRDRIVAAVRRPAETGNVRYEAIADAVLAVLPAPAGRADVLREAADALGRMDYDTDSQDYGYDTYRDAWNGGVMDGAGLLRRLAEQAKARCGQDIETALGTYPCERNAGHPGDCDERTEAEIVEQQSAPAVAQPDEEADGNRIVAYRSALPGALSVYCTRHTGELGDGVVPLTSDDLPDGGICTYPECGTDVLIPQPGKEA